jgi:hypothetical protein
MWFSDYGAKAIPMLAEVFRDSRIDSRIREKAVYVLGLLPGDTSNLIREAAKHDDVRVRRGAAATAANLGPELAGPILARLVVDTDSTVRHIAANHLPVPSRGLAMTKDKSTKKVEAESASATPCERGGSEMREAVIRFRHGDDAEFHYFICKTTARTRIFLVLHQTQSQLLVDEQSKNEIKLVLPPLPPGRHLLYWGFQGAGLRWQSRAELLVDGICRFRHRKSSEGDDPVNRGFLLLEVI